jgi:hypothetical protein
VNQRTRDCLPNTLGVASSVKRLENPGGEIR